MKRSDSKGIFLAIPAIPAIRLSFSPRIAGRDPGDPSGLLGNRRQNSMASRTLERSRAVLDSGSGVRMALLTVSLHKFSEPASK
jgi:hypothetical protein